MHNNQIFKMSREYERTNNYH